MAEDRYIEHVQGQLSTDAHEDDLDRMSANVNKSAFYNHASEKSLSHAGKLRVFLPIKCIFPLHNFEKDRCALLCKVIVCACFELFSR